MRAALGYSLALLAILGFALVRGRLPSAGAAEGPAAATSAAASSAPAAERPRPQGWVGIVLANRTVDVSPRVASLVRAANVRPGDLVKQGTVLATLDARDKVARARAAGAAQRNQAERAARSQRMHEASLVSAEEAESARFEAERQSAELELARVLVDDAVVRAPFDGTVVARFIEPGTHVAAGAPMFRMIDTNGARVRFGVPSTVADAMEVGVAVRFSTLAAPGVFARARVTSVSPEVDRSAGLVVVEADAGSIGTFRSGSQVTVFPDDAPSSP